MRPLPSGNRLRQRGNKKGRPTGAAPGPAGSDRQAAGEDRSAKGSRPIVRSSAVDRSTSRRAWIRVSPGSPHDLSKIVR